MAKRQELMSDDKKNIIACFIQQYDIKYFIYILKRNRAKNK